MAVSRFSVGARARARLPALLGGNRGDLTFKAIALLSTLSLLAIAGLMVFEVVVGAGDSFEALGFFQFLASTAWNPVTGDFGALHVLVGTLVSSLLAIVLAVPLALGIAIFITEQAPPWLRGPVSFLVDILAAIPSIVYGLWGIFVLVPIVRDPVSAFLKEHLGFIPLFQGTAVGVSMLAAGFILAIMIVPIVSAVAREMIAQVPVGQKEALVALGATKWEVIWKVILPYARGGIVGAVILGLARALGETMAVTMVIGNSHQLTWSLLEPNSTMASVIANEFTEAGSDIHLSALIHVGLVLMIVALIVNAIARLLVWSVARGPGGGATA